MKALLLNALLGLTLGRFGSVWLLSVFLPLVALELAYGVYFYHLTLHEGFIRRAIVLMVCGQFGFMLGALLRPMRGET